MSIWIVEPSNPSTIAAKINPVAQFFQHLPLLVVSGCIVLFVAFCLLSVFLHISSQRLTDSIASLSGLLETLDSPRSWKNGLSFDEWSDLRGRMKSLTGVAGQWASCLSQHIEAYPGLSGEDVYFRTEGAREALPYEDVVSSMHPQRYSSFPGLLTGAGLTLTFVAILLALSGVKYDPSNSTDPIRGIDVLINGLSGKFTSSIVALSLSILFTLYEQRRMRLVRCAYSRLLQAIDNTLPKLSSTRILLDIQQSLTRSRAGTLRQ